MSVALERFRVDHTAKLEEARQMEEMFFADTCDHIRLERMIAGQL